MIPFKKYLDPSLVLFSDLNNRDEVLHALTDLAQKQGKITDQKTFYDAVLSREKIVTTGIGMGVAIPHAKLTDCRHFFIAVAVLKKGVAWNSLDGSPVRMVFLIGGPDDKQTEYLKLLSSLTQSLKGEATRKQLLQAETPEEVCHHLGV